MTQYFINKRVNNVCLLFSQTLFAYLWYKALHPRPDYFKPSELDAPSTHWFLNHRTGSIILARLLSFNLMMKTKRWGAGEGQKMGDETDGGKCRSIESEVKQSSQIYEGYIRITIITGFQLVKLAFKKHSYLTKRLPKAMAATHNDVDVYFCLAHNVMLCVLYRKSIWRWSNVVTKYNNKTTNRFFL